MSTKELIQPPKSFKPEGEAVNPYLAAKQEWDTRIGTARVQASNWRLVAFGSVLLSIILAAGLIFQSSKSMVTPYVVQVGPDGSVQTVGPATQSNYIPQEKEVKFFLAKFVKSARSVPLDPVVYRNNWEGVYAYLTQGASVKMNELMSKDETTKKIGKETVQATIISVLPQTKDTYQIRWTEDVYSDGRKQRSETMAGLFTIEIREVKDEKEILSNPLGLFIKDFNWAKEN